MNFPKKLQKKLLHRVENKSIRELKNSKNLIDFSSNDYLGFSKEVSILKNAHQFLLDHKITENGATGSRLISGNHQLYEEVESQLERVHQSESALIFNSGYDTNVGFFSSVPQKGDIILYDEFIHASIRDGISMSHAKAYKFRHNDLQHLESLLNRYTTSEEHLYVVTESVFSMDGDTPDLHKITTLCKRFEAYLIVDEAHAVGVFGEKGMGKIQELGLQSELFARIVTFGKALGCHGAAILGNTELKNYLVNFARSFIYTTGLPPHSLATILESYELLNSSSNQTLLKNNIRFFQEEIHRLHLSSFFIKSDSAIHCCIIQGNHRVKELSLLLEEKGFDAKPILSPTVPKGQERIRFCLHSYNSHEEITDVLETLRTFVKPH